MAISVFVGRFQPFHHGHLEQITRALSFPNREVLIVIGYSGVNGSLSDPFSVALRKTMILESLPLDFLSRVTIAAIGDCPDHDKEWYYNLYKLINENSQSSDKMIVVHGDTTDDNSQWIEEFSQLDDRIIVDHFYHNTGYRGTDIRKILFTPLHAWHDQAVGDEPDWNKLAEMVPPGTMKVLRAWVKEFRYKGYCDNYKACLES